MTTRDERIRVAAHNAHTAVLQSPPEQESHKTILDVQRVLHASLAGDFHQVLSELVDECIHEARMVSLTGVDPVEEGERKQPKADELRRAMDLALGELDRYESHACDFSDDGRCAVCGADGRA